jgi:hypothetical protein
LNNETINCRTLLEGFHGKKSKKKSDAIWRIATRFVRSRLVRANGASAVDVRWDLFRAYSAAGRKDDASRMRQEIEKLSDENNAPH